MTEADTNQAKPEDLLREEIINDARRQAKRIARRAQQEADKHAQDTDSRAKAFDETTLAQAGSEAEKIRRLQMAKIPIAKRRMRAQFIEDHLNSLNLLARQRLAPEKNPLSREALIKLIAQGVSQMRGDHFTMSLAPQDLKSLGDDFIDELRTASGKSELTIEMAEPLPPSDSGPLLTDRDGRQRWDNRLQQRLSRLWPNLRREIAKMLDQE